MHAFLNDHLPYALVPKPQPSNLQILRGRDGCDGRDGRDGQVGLPGPRGLAEPKGDMGAPWLKGDKGSHAGQKGDTGDPGLKGDIGLPGKREIWWILD